MKACTLGSFSYISMISSSSPSASFGEPSLRSRRIVRRGTTRRQLAAPGVALTPAGVRSVLLSSVPRSCPATAGCSGNRRWRGSWATSRHRQQPGPAAGQRLRRPRDVQSVRRRSPAAHAADASRNGFNAACQRDAVRIPCLRP